MGDAAEMMLDGTLDDMGEYIDGKSPGYPRPRHFNKGSAKPKVTVNSIQKLRAVIIACKVYKKWHQVAFEYRNTPIGNRDLNNTKSLQSLARGICNELPRFEQYCKLLSIKREQDIKNNHSSADNSSSTGGNSDSSQ